MTLKNLKTLLLKTGLVISLVLVSNVCSAQVQCAKEYLWAFGAHHYYSTQICTFQNGPPPTCSSADADEIYGYLRQVEPGCKLNSTQTDCECKDGLTKDVEIGGGMITVRRFGSFLIPTNKTMNRYFQKVVYIRNPAGNIIDCYLCIKFEYFLPGSTLPDIHQKMVFRFARNYYPTPTTNPEYDYVDGTQTGNNITFGSETFDRMNNNVSIP